MASDLPSRSTALAVVSTLHIELIKKYVLLFSRPFPFIWSLVPMSYLSIYPYLQICLRSYTTFLHFFKKIILQWTIYIVCDLYPLLLFSIYCIIKMGNKISYIQKEMQALTNV